MKHIPLVDLKAQYAAIKNEVDNALRSVIRDAAFVGNRNNPYVRAFEEAFASYLGTKHCVACGNGTDAIEIALKALGVGKGDEVIVPALSWISTSEAVSNVGATPVFVDIDPRYYTMDSAKIEDKITAKTKAVMPVHLYGQPAEIDAIIKIAKKHGLFVIEDCAQAHGAEYDGKKVGTFGDAAIFSFFPGKILGAYGDAGCIVTNDEALEEKCRLIANHGQIKKGEHLEEGRNSRMDGIQAAVLCAKLPFLDKWVFARRNVAKIYGENLSGSGIVIPEERPRGKHSFHLYVIRIKHRNAAKEKLAKAGIDSGIHYPVALPFLKPYEKFGYSEKDFPAARAAISEILSLPIYPELKKKDLLHITKTLADIAKHE